MAQPLPVVVGVAQFNPRAAAMAEAPEPLEMMARVARAAAEDCGAPAILGTLDTLAVVNVLSRNYRNAPAALAALLRIAPARQIYTTIGGDTPQYLLNHLAEQIAAGTVRAAMVVGAEAMHTARRLMKQSALKWGAADRDGPPTVLGEARPGTSPLEEHYGARLPVHIYPLFENARRAHRGWSIEQSRGRMGRLFAGMTKVAAVNPYAWFPAERTAEELSAPSAHNRIICFPYPKLLNAIIDVDLAAAVILASDVEARRLGIRDDRMVYLHGAADAVERWFISERPNYHSSAALAATAQAALHGAGVEAEQIDYFDFYSCFPAAVGFALDALGLGPDDPRGVTVTGGLPYAGGPGNNYVTHSVAAMTERLRANPDKLGMVTALGWYFTKHAAAVYGAAAPRGPFVRRGRDALRGKIGAAPAVELAEAAEGEAVVETYTVIHDRAGAPSEAIVIGRLGSGARFFARAPREALAAMEREEFVGRRGRVKVLDGFNQFDPA